MAGAGRSAAQSEYFIGGVNVAQAQLDGDHRISRSAWTRVAVTGGIGLIGLLLTITVTILVARSIIRRLGGLERNALQLAEDQLPDVVGRLRRGENVDVNAEAPALRIGRDEIGRVGQAFDLVRQTAIRAAVDEARLRQGLNDVFRSLARRSQSLLHRQLTLLDQMERRASDPEALDDLFRLDHLTTRMRRHAEGLVILAGAPPGRGWSSPVRMVDVMRGAIAEVEDYARVSVATRSQAALTGSAVADVIHLLAELIENATTLSPPYTSVRVSGDTVANGFAIEVEDRGLGMSPSRLTELNERLGNPPEFNPSDSEQLGLFVVSQLAKRHGIRVTLRASPYGGTAAIVLIPRHLVVTEEAFRAGLPGEPAMAQLSTNGNHAVPAGPASPAELGGQGPGASAGFTEIGADARARADARGPYLRTAAPFPGSRPGAARARHARHARARRGERRGGPRAGRPAEAASRPAGDGGRGRPGAGQRRLDAVRRPAVLLRRVHAAAASGPGRDARAGRRRAQRASPGQRGLHRIAAVSRGRLVAVRGPGFGALPRWRRPVSRPARAVPGLDAAQHTGCSRRAWWADYPDDAGGLTAPWTRSPGRRGRSPGRPGRFPPRRVRLDPGCRTGLLTRLPPSRGPTATSRACRAGSGRPAWPPSSGTTRRRGGRRWPAAGRPAVPPARPDRPGLRGLRGLRALRVQARPRSGRPCRRCSAAGRKAGRGGWPRPRASRRARALARPPEPGRTRPPAATPVTQPRMRMHVGTPMDHDAGAAGRVGQLDWLLDDLVRRVGHVTKAVILSQDGMALGASQTLGRDDAEHLAALAAGFQSLARGAERHFGNGGGVRQTIIEMESGFLLTSAAGSGTCLAVIAEQAADLGLVAYEMAILVRRTGEHIRVNTRTSALSGWG